MARNFASEWLRPDAPDHADTALLDTLSTAMVAFYAVTSQAVERRALASASASSHPEPFSENETKDVLTALYQDGHVDLVLADRVAALMASKG